MSTLATRISAARSASASFAASSTCNQSAAGGRGIGNAHRRCSAAHGRFLERRLLRSRRAAADLLWTFGDGQTRPPANPQHTYARPASIQARLTVSDGVNSTLSTPIVITVGNQPVVTLHTTPSSGRPVQGGRRDLLQRTATDTEDGELPASAFTWNIDFLHEGHVHPGTAATGVTSGTFTDPDERA